MFAAVSESVSSPGRPRGRQDACHGLHEPDVGSAAVAGPVYGGVAGHTADWPGGPGRAGQQGTTGPLHRSVVVS